jgi:uroporphyrinogen-III synthase
MDTYTILSTKKLKPSLIDQAKENHIAIVEEEFIKIKPLLTREKWDELSALFPSRNNHVVFTSSHAVSAVSKYVHPYISYEDLHWKIFCLSGRTREAVSEHTLPGEIIDTAANAEALAQKIITYGVSEVIFFCGNRRREELPHLLQAHGVRVHEVSVYETIDAPVQITASIDGILFFSPSAVGSFFSANQLKPDTVCFAIGKTTAQAIKEQSNNKIITSELPTQEDILESVLHYFQNNNNHE